MRLVAVVQDSPAPTPKKAAGQGLSLALLIVSIGVVAVLAIWLLAVLRRGRRLREQAGSAPRTRYTDAWAESGRRLEVPPAPEDLREREGDQR